MSQLPTNDQTLINFLKQYRSTAPEATPELEELIMATLDTDERLKESQHQSSPPPNNNSGFGMGFLFDCCQFDSTVDRRSHPSSPIINNP